MRDSDSDSEMSSQGGLDNYFLMLFLASSLSIRVIRIIQFPILLYYVSLCPPLSLFVSVRLYPFLSVCQSLFFICLTPMLSFSLCLSVSPCFFHLSVCLFVCLSYYLFSQFFVSLSVSVHQALFFICLVFRLYPRILSSRQCFV